MWSKVCDTHCCSNTRYLSSHKNRGFPRLPGGGETRARARFIFSLQHQLLKKEPCNNFRSRFECWNIDINKDWGQIVTSSSSTNIRVKYLRYKRCHFALMRSRAAESHSYIYIGPANREQSSIVISDLSLPFYTIKYLIKAELIRKRNTWTYKHGVMRTI